MLNEDDTGAGVVNSQALRSIYSRYGEKRGEQQLQENSRNLMEIILNLDFGRQIFGIQFLIMFPEEIEHFLVNLKDEALKK